LAETATRVAEDLQRNLRIGKISVAEIRAQGRDVQVGRYQASENVCIAMFSGGGLAWAGAAMKRGEITIPRADPGAHPDLSGLCCRYDLIPSRCGQMVTLTVPSPRAQPGDFRSVVKEIAYIVEATPDALRPAMSILLMAHRTVTRLLRLPSSRRSQSDLCRPYR